MAKTKLTRSQLPAIKASLMQQQGGACPLCLRPFKGMESKNIVVDHCHTHGYIRAALCRNCNGREGEILNRAVRAAVGSDTDPAAWLRRLAAYWVKHAEPQTQYIHPTHKTPAEKEAETRRKRAAAARKRRAAKKES